jgi:hypothetical protein
MADDTEAPVEGVNQTTISNAGLDPFSREIQRIEGRRQAMLDTSSALSNQRSAAFSGMEDLTRQKNAAGAPVRDRLQTLASNVPSSKVDLERSPDFQAPMADPKEMQQSFGILMAASMLVGAASRSPFYGAMQAMGGAMQGWQQQDERMFKDSLAKFQVNLAAIKERNQAKREEVDSAVKDYSNNIAGLKAQLEVIAQKYDDQIGLATLRTKSIGEAQKVLENNIEKENQAVERLLRDQANMKAAEARLAESRERQAALDEQRQFYRGIASDRDRRAAESQGDRLDRTRFRDEQALRKEYLKESKPVQDELAKVEKILLIADKGGGFADNQLRQAISDFQKGARGTNAMIASMTNFGSLDERVAGTLNRFFAGEYTPEQRGDIINLFKTLREDILKPGLAEQQSRYRYLAEKNRLKPDQVVAPEGAPPAPPAPAPGGAPKPNGALPPVKVSLAAEDEA